VNEYIGMDIEVSGNHDGKLFADVYYDGNTIPFETESIDGVFSSETFEHIFNLDTIIAEIYRVLKLNGLILITCPFTWPEHEVPYDYARYTSFAIKDKLINQGFEIIDFTKTGNYISSVIQLQSLYVYFMTNRLPIINHLLFLLLITPQFLLADLLTLILPKRMKRQDLYLNNIILAKKISGGGNQATKS
jgi:Methyltransferase domain.